jgi:hypothetical protein
MMVGLKNRIKNIEKDQTDVVKHIESKYNDALLKVKDLVDFHEEILEK